MLISSFLVHRKTKSAILIKDNIYSSDSIPSPFVFGFIKPKIYLPDSLGESHSEYIIAHENAHIRRLDHIVKPLGFIILSIHWFNPLMWLSYILFCRDIEFACDEDVVKKMTSPERADYSQALLDCSVKSRVLTVCPTSFGEVGVKSRIKMVYWISPTIETPENTDNFTTHTIYFAVEESSENYTNLGWIFEEEFEETYNNALNALTGIYNDYLNKNSQEIVILKDKDYSVTFRNVNDIFEASPKKQISEFISALCLGDKEVVDIYIGGSIENFDSIKMDAYATLTDNYTTALVYLDVQKSDSPAFPEGQYQYLLKLNESPYLSVVEFFGKAEKYALYNAPITAYYTSDPLLDDALRFTYQDLIRIGDYSENIENHAFHIMRHSLPNAEDGYSDYETIEKYFFDRFGIEVNKSYSIRRELDGIKTVIDGEEKYMAGCAHGADASANIFEKIEQKGNKYSISFIFHSDFAYISESERRTFTFEKVEGSDILRFIKFESEKLSSEKTAGYTF